MANFCTTIPDASATTPGLVNTVAQEFAGVKTFNDEILAGGFFFENEVNTGFQRGSGSNYELAIAGTPVISMLGTDVFANVRFTFLEPARFFTDGSVTIPNLAWTLDTNTGLYRIAADTMGFTAGGIEQLRIGTTGVQVALDGSASAPVWSWSTDTNTGFYRIAADTIGVSTGGAELVRMTPNVVGINTGAAVQNDSNVPIQLTAPAAGEQYFGMNKAAAYGALFGFSNGSFLDKTGGIFRMVSGDSFYLYMNSTTLAFEVFSTGGMVLGNATGGDKGFGTINAVAVYDDNTLLTDWVFDLAYDGQVRVEDEPLHGQDTLWTIDDTQAFAEDHRHLPSLPSRKEWEQYGKASVGELVTKLWETVERQQLHIFDLNDRLKRLEA